MPFLKFLFYFLNIKHLTTVFLHYFDHNDVTNGHFDPKGHPQNDPNFFHSSMNSTGCCQGELYGHHVHVGRTKYDFHPLRLYFYTILTVMTSQMTIFLWRAILKN